MRSGSSVFLFFYVETKDPNLCFSLDKVTYNMYICRKRLVHTGGTGLNRTLEVRAVACQPEGRRFDPHL